MAMPRRWPTTPYAYMFCYPDGVPYYVGVGEGNRACSVRRNKWANHVDAKIRRDGYATLRVIVECLTREEALSLEKRWIQRYGRRHLGVGVLTNITAGGDGGSSGRVWTADMRNRVSAAHLGRKWSLERRRRQSAALCGNRNAEGLCHSDETKLKISTALKGRKLTLSEEERRRRAMCMSERNRRCPPRTGLPVTSEHRLKLSIARRKREDYSGSKCE